MRRIKNPCVGICEFVGPEQWCLGCSQTRKECQNWEKMRPYDQKILLKSLQKRRSKIRTRATKKKSGDKD